jgi:peptidoglycan biosynthesis protein MviN/MurJ (putative lipid II flippase)
VCSYLQVGILLYVLRRRLGAELFEGWLKSLLKTAAATAVMAAAGLVLLGLFGRGAGGTIRDLVQIGTMVAVCCGVFLLVSWLGGNEMLGLLLSGGRSSKGQDAGALE